MDEYDKIAHLLRRAGFGAQPEELEAYARKGLEATVDELINFEQIPDNLAAPPGGLDDPQKPKQTKFMADLRDWWLNAMSETTRPLQEKMVLFWHQLFATSSKGVDDARQLLLQLELFRGNFRADFNDDSPNPFPVGNFRKMLEDLTKDPAMLFWLDNRRNSKLSSEVGSNENYARELMELFSLGVEDVVAKIPNFSEHDVRQASRALTGWSVWRHKTPLPHDLPNNFPRWFAFEPRDKRGRIKVPHDYGPYEVLGVTFAGDGRQLFDIIVQHKNPGELRSASGRFLGYRLFSFFGYDNPEPEIIDALADVFDTGTPQYNIRNMLRTIFMPGNLVAEAFYSQRAFKAKIKSPTEFVIAAVRLLTAGNVTALDGLDHRRRMAQMGQTLLQPFDVSGWEGKLGWINSTFLFARFNFAIQLSQHPAVPVEQMIRQNNLQTAEQLVDFFGNRLLQVPLTSEARTQLIDYMVADDNGDPAPFVLDQTTIDKKVRRLISLLMMTPEFQLN